MRYTTLLSGGVATLLVTSCFSPQPIFRLEPATEPSSWFYGREVLTREYEDLRVSMIFEQWAGNELVFATEIINRSRDTVLVAPETFFYEAFRHDTAQASTVTPALDPEREILEIEKAIAWERADRRNAFVFDVALMAAAVTAQVALAATSDGEVYSEDEGSVGFYFGGTGSSDDVPFLNHLRQQWTYQALRKTSLPPGQAMRGNVVFRDQPGAARYTVYVQIDDHLLPFDYRKRVIQP